MGAWKRMFMFELSFAPLKGKGNQVKDGQGCLRISTLTGKSFPHCGQPFPNLPRRTREETRRKNKRSTGNFSACFYPPSPKTTARSPRESSDHGVKATKADHFPMCGGRAAREPWEAEPGSIRNPWPWLSRPTSEEHEATPTAALPSPLAAAKNQTHHRREPHQGQLPGAGKVSLGSQVLFNYLSNIPN